MGLTRGTRSADITDLLTAISGEIVADLSHMDGGGFVSIRVPENSERTAILRAYRDARVRYADVNAIGPVVMGAPR